ncbi:hypothetical protein [Massilia glaciei]|uniref:Metal ABC transporter ATP-binding protein n=1 Tax=Massilia glaciei TaxID=1524097 RepID=A0A2U2I665_9BURK|nr:hypothetical protein [Massilia glaciei]PWF55129.1 hypothetical protein C7C56_003410 [Massilia glaciei]
MKKSTLAALALCIGLGGCATASKDVPTTYMSPKLFETYNCAQLSSELQRISTRVVQLGGRLDKAASNDKALTGVGVILFWPALLHLGGTKVPEANYARLKGEFDAVQQSLNIKQCPAEAIVAAK